MRHHRLAGSLLSCVLAVPAAAVAWPAVAMAQTAPAAPAGQLADAVLPTAYRLDLTVDPAKDRFSGHVEIEASVKQPDRFIYLHGKELAVSRASATIGGKTYPATWKQVDESGVVLLTFAEPLPAGPATFSFDYDAPFGEGPAGMFRVKVGDQWYSWTQFESTDARAAFPSFDQPGYKQPFTITLRTPKGQTAISNAPEVEMRDEGDWTLHRFAPTAPLPTYLAAMMVGPFAVAQGEVPPTPQRAQPLPLRIVSTQQNKDKLGFALENSKRIVALLEDYFGDAFPYPKLDQITAPIMPGAMENAGADLYEDNLLILDDHASTDQKRGFGMVVGHELAHQWFGDLVTPAWWDDIWLNESFANWMGYRIGNAWRPDLNIGKGALAEGFGAMGTDALLAGRPIHQKIATNAQIDAAFDTITYGKGGHVVAMIAAFMGDDKFKAGVRAYMAEHRYGNATSADFFGAMAKVAGDPALLPAMQSFTDQQGVPLLTFSGADGRYTVTQSRYARLGTHAPQQTQQQTWGVPMCLRAGEERQCQLLTAVSAPVTLAGKGALMPNAGGTGYYRFELPRADWDRLIAVSDTLSGGEGLALADSLRASFMAGRASASQLAEMARVMVRNPDSYASDAATAGLQALEAWGMLDAPATTAYRAFVGKLYRPLLAKAGFNPALGAYADEEPEASQRRAQYVGQLSGTARDTVVRGKLAAAAKAWLAGDKAALDPSWYGAGFGAWLAAEDRIEGGGLLAAKKLYERALASTDPLFRPSALGVVARSGKADIARWVLEDARDKRLRLSERLSLVMGVAVSGRTRDMGYEWMRGHSDEMLTGGAGIFLGARLPQVFAGYCSVAKADSILKDFAPKLAGKTGELELARAVERVRSCGVLKEKRAVDVSAQIARLK